MTPTEHLDDLVSKLDKAEDESYPMVPSGLLSLASQTIRLARSRTGWIEQERGGDSGYAESAARRAIEYIDSFTSAMSEEELAEFLTDIDEYIVNRLSDVDTVIGEENDCANND